MKLALKIMNEVFNIIEYPYPLRNELSELKESTSLNEFRSKVKTWKPENYPCKICKIYFQRIGYFQVAG